MVNPETARYADIFAALGSEPRLEIMRLLFAAHPGGMTVGDLQAQLKIPNSTLSHHLEKLRVEGLVESKRDKQFLWYSANASTVAALLSFLYSGCSINNLPALLAEAASPSLDDIEHFVEPIHPSLKEGRAMFEGFLRSMNSLFGGAFDRFFFPRGFEQFTRKAIQSISLAQGESQRLQHAYVGTEQLLLGLLEEGTGIAGQVLTSVGLNSDQVRAEVERQIGRGKGTPAEIPFTPRAKRTLELAVKQSHQMGHAFIGTEHLLLGILREGQGLAIRVLENLNINPQALEQQVRAAMSTLPFEEGA